MSELIDLREDLKAAKYKLIDQIFQIDGINGIGLGLNESGEHALKVMMVDDSVDTSVLPKSIDGFDVEYKIVGVIRAL